MEERRVERIGECMRTFADVDRQVLPIVGKCLDGMTKAAEAIEAKAVSSHLDTLRSIGHVRHITYKYVVLVSLDMNHRRVFMIRDSRFKIQGSRFLS